MDINTRHIILGLLIFLMPFSVVSQKKMRTSKIKRIARKAYARGDFYTSKYYYELYCERKPDNLKYKNRLARLQYYTRDYKKARINYSELNKKNAIDFPMASFYAAKSYQMTAMYDSAIVFYKIFVKDYNKEIIDRKFKKLSEAGIEGCNNAIQFKDSVLKIAIIHLDTSINKAYNEFSPIPIDDKILWYAGIRSDTIVDRDVKVQKQFYKAIKVDNHWENLGLLKTGFNIPSVTTGNGAMSSTGKRFYFTRCSNNINEKRICKLFVSDKINGTWTNAVELPPNVNSIEFTSTQPTVGSYSKNKGKEIIYFVSDRPGGKGGYDIWYTLYNKHTKKYSDARTVGSINGPGDEKTPFYDSKQRILYYSSDSYPGYGGLDIFKSTGEKKNWTEPVNMEKPLNSSYDDIYFVNFNSEKGYLVSNRDGGIAFKNENCCDDIYSFRWTSFIHFAIDGLVVELLNDEDVSEYQDLPDATVKLYIIDNNLEEDILIEEMTSDNIGHFFTDIEVGRLYKIVVSKDKYFNKSYEFNTKGIDYSDTLFHQFALQKIPEKPIVLNNIYFEFDSDILLDSSKVSIDTTLIVILNDNPDLKIRIQAHTDSKGNDDYNLDLSKRRAASVVSYLVSQEISYKRLTSEGYGESMPVAPNNNPDGSDNPEGRQMNRRVEFVVVQD